MTKKGSRLSFNLATILKKQLQSIDEEQQKTYAELFIETLIERAVIHKETQAYKLIFSYIDGLPKQQIEVDTGENINALLEEINGINKLQQETIGEQEVEDESPV